MGPLWLHQGYGLVDQVLKEWEWIITRVTEEVIGEKLLIVCGWEAT